MTLTVYVVVLAMLAGCSSPPPYFDVNSEIHQAGPAAVGETIYVGVAFLRSREGDTVELEGLELVDPTLGAAEVESFAVDMRGVEGDSIGFVAESDPMSSAATLAALAPIEGFRFSAAESWHPIAIVTGITDDEPGNVGFRAITLLFRVNDGPIQRQEIPSGVLVCVADPRPDSCG